jgi:hypothetical protein
MKKISNQYILRAAHVRAIQSMEDIILNRIEYSQIREEVDKFSKKVLGKNYKLVNQKNIFFKAIGNLIGKY